MKDRLTDCPEYRLVQVDFLPPHVLLFDHEAEIVSCGEIAHASYRAQQEYLDDELREQIDARLAQLRLDLSVPTE